MKTSDADSLIDELSNEEKAAFMTCAYIGPAWLKNTVAFKWLRQNLPISKKDAMIDYFCPCGSGKKYKKCCYQDDQVTTLYDDYDIDISQEIINRIEDDDSESCSDEDRAFYEKEIINTIEIEEFSGLTTYQMERLLYYPYDSLDVITFTNRFKRIPSAPVIALFKMLISNIGEKGLKSTANGNLPMKIVNEAAACLRKNPEYGQLAFIFIPIRSETDFNELHIMRVISESCGFIQFSRNKFIRGQEYDGMLTEYTKADVYQKFLQAYTTRIDWNYMDLNEGMDFIQQTFFFILYLLSKHGNEWQSSTFYEDAFIEAFPCAIDDVKLKGSASKEKELRSCFTSRCLVNAGIYLGLIETKEKYPGSRCSEFHLKKTDLLDEAIKFHI